LANYFQFIPIATETLGTFGPEAIKFLEDLGHKLGLISSVKRAKSFLFQSLGISIQKGNAACILGTKKNLWQTGRTLIPLTTTIVHV
jgi:hypothetical protein